MTIYFTKSVAEAYQREIVEAKALYGIRDRIDYSVFDLEQARNFPAYGVLFTSDMEDFNYSVYLDGAQVVSLNLANTSIYKSVQFYIRLH